MDQHTYTVSELTGRVAVTLSRAFPDEVWVQGEIRDLSRSQNGHVYFSLVDPGTDGRESLLPVTLFASDRMAVNRVLLRSGAGRMSDGIEVRIRGRLGLYSQRSTVQLRMTWIDTDYTLGRLAAERTALIELLTADGTLARNRSLPMPLVPLRIGLITSRGSAAHADFVTELERSGFGFRVSVAHATVQGVDAPESIAAAFLALGGRHIDVVALVRGGGAQTELATFDTEAVARAVAGCAVPVMTGIGHETDQTVADLAAHGAFKTPTATAQAIVGAVRAYVDRLDRISVAVHRTHRTAISKSVHRVDGLSLRLRSGAARHLERSDYRIGVAVSRLDHGAQRTIGAARRRLELGAVQSHRISRHQLDRSSTAIERYVDGVDKAARRAIATAGQRLDVLRAMVQGADPAAMFAKGWSIVYAPDGSAVRHPDQVGVADRLRTVVESGTLFSVVIEPEENP